MEDARRVRADTGAKKHIAQLADGGISEHTFYIGLRQRDGCSK